MAVSIDQVPWTDPMLIGRARPQVPTAGFSVEPKLDGFRCHVAVCPSGVQARTRSGRDITASLPHLDGLADAGVSVAFDGELVAGAGRPDDFYDVASTLAVRTRHGRASFVAFDVTWLEGSATTDLTYRQRRALLDAAADATGVLVVPRFDGGDTLEVFAACEQLGIEGIVVKDDASRYTPGERSNRWRKAKIADWAARHARRRRPTPRPVASR